MEYAQLNPTDTNIQRTPEEIKAGVRAKLEETVTAVSDKSRQMARYADRRVQENPWTAVGTGFGVGVLFGTLVTLLAVRR
jgi:ElaB/YqjD/DUF883 family membrane-anchored ribosome-binding protein